MQRNLLRTMMTAVVMCSTIWLMSSSAETLSYGPHLDVPIPVMAPQAALQCPPMISVDCDDADVYTTFAEFEAAGGELTNLPSECMVDSFALVEQLLLDQMGCVYFYTREYYVHETCGNEYTCFQPVMWMDDIPPTIVDCPMDVVIPVDGSGNCQAQYSVPDINTSDGCSDVTITDNAPVLFDLGVTTVTITATDQCGNSDQCSFTVTVTNQAPLTVTCPADITVSDVCDPVDVAPYADFMAFEAAGGSAVDACMSMGNSFSITDVSNGIVGGSCPKTVNRTYTITDSNGNTGSCTQVITAEDNDMPTFTVPNNTVVNCESALDTSITGTPSNVLDNCDSSPAISFYDEFEPGMCTGEGTITRNWIVTDECLNADTLIQFVSVIDTIAPTAMCVDTAFFYLDELGNADLIVEDMDNGSFDNCSDVTLSTPIPVYSCNQIAAPIPTTLMVTDECGNESMCELIVVLLDTMDVVLTAPATDSIFCIENAQAPFTTIGDFMNDGGILEDGCIDIPSFTLLSVDTTGTCPSLINRIYEYTDFSGNSDTALHVIYVNDTVSPTITMCPDDITISGMEYCDTLISFDVPLVTDNCDGLVVTNDYTNSTATTAVFEGGVHIITFTASDICGNSATCQMTVTVEADPRITFPPLGSINSEEDLVDYNDIDAFILAGGMINEFCAFDSTTFDYESDFEITEDPCFALVTETVTIMDTVGNSYMSTNDTLVEDIQMPTISGCFPIVIRNLDPVTCTYDMELDTPIVSDNFGIDTIYASMSDNLNDTIDVLWTVEDLCGNINTCQTQYVIFDGVSPDLQIADTTAMCSVDMIAPFMTIDEFLTGTDAVVFDCRLDSTSFLFEGDSITPSGTILRTYSVTDLRGQYNSTQQVITILDTTEPIISCPSDINTTVDDNLTCGATITIDLPTTSDNCGQIVSLVHDYPLALDSANASGFYPVGTTIITWTATDDSGLEAICSISVNVVDNLAPEVSCPADTIIECSILNYPAVTDITGFIDAGGVVVEGCSIDSVGSMTVESSINVYERTYEIFDSAGLSTTCVQTITVIDTVAPEFGFCLPYFVQTDPGQCSAQISIPAPNATDNCNLIDTIFNDRTFTDDASGTFGIGRDTILWFVFDTEGNFDTCSTFINVIDGESPDVTDASDTTIMCIDNMVDTLMTVEDIFAAGGSATDNCGIEFVNLLSENQVSSDTIIRFYQVVDSSGLSATLSHTIIIDDTTPPTVQAPADVTIECSIPIDSLEITGTVDSSIFLMDNCMQFDTLIYIDEIVADICPFKQSITRIWIATDDSGNEARDTQMIRTVDTEKPVFDSLPDALAAINCDDPFPAQELLSAMDACGSAIVVGDTLPYNEDICSGYSVTYRWIATDECGLKDTVTTSFDVNPDMTPPTLVLLEDVTIDTDTDLCMASLDRVAPPIFSEDCDTVIIERIYNFPVYKFGENIVQWRASNSCGIDTTVSQNVFVEDNQLPTATCVDLAVGLTAPGQNYIPAMSFVTDLIDNCGVDTVLVRRLTPACEDADNDVFGDVVFYCCDDKDSSFDVEVMIRDNSGNENFCTASVTVDDKNAPVVEEQLPPILISCAYALDTADLSAFGTFVQEEELRQDIIVDDVYYDPSDGFAGRDGRVFEECELTISEEIQVNLDQCSQGTLTRIFTFTDDTGNSSTAFQTITVMDNTPFNIDGNDIIWPGEFSWDQCINPAPDTSLSGSPIFLNDDQCALVSANFEDQVFDYPNTGCPYVRRKWTVIDWCQYDSSQDPNPGKWTYNQHIFVNNTTPPSITSTCTDTLICAPGNACSGSVSLSITAEDDCNTDPEVLFYQYSVDLNDDGSNEMNGNTAIFESSVPNGNHRIYWTVEDRCGNVSECNYAFTMMECKAPTPICLTGLAIDIAGNGQIELWASDINYGSFDNCTEQTDLLLSFSQDVSNTNVTFTCDDIGEQPVSLWVTDEAGNQSFCETTIDVQDNLNSCGSGPNGLIAGRIATETNVSISDAKVNIIGAEYDNYDMSDVDGAYAFDDISMEGQYQVAPTKNGNHLQGVTTLDLVKIQRHILELEILDSPYKLIAADVNDNEVLSASDLLILRKLILGIYEEFPDNNSWRFISKAGVMNDMENPWPFNEDVYLEADILDEVDKDFVGVKIGDVTNSVDDELRKGNTTTRSTSFYELSVKDQSYRRDELVYMDVHTSDAIALGALQSRISWDTEKLNLIDVIPVELSLNADHYTDHDAENGKLSVAYTTEDAALFDDNAVLFQLVFEADGSGKLSQDVRLLDEWISPLLYDQNDSEYLVTLRFDSSEDKQLVLHQNKPNPFLYETVVEFELPEDQEVTFKIFDATGAMVSKITGHYAEGYNTLLLKDELEGVSGILYLKMETAEFSDSKRLIKIE